MKTTLQSNTVKMGIVQVLSGLAGYLSGQMDAVAATTLAVTGLIQIGQRLLSLKSEAAQAATSSTQGG